MQTSVAAVTLVITLTVIAQVASAQEAPTVGLLYNTQESHSLTYRCEPARDGQLNCEFIQTAIRLKATAAQLPDVIERARKQFRAEKPPTAQECGTFRDMVAVLEGKKPAPKPKAMSSLSPLEKSDALRTARLLNAYCEKPTEENFVEVVRAGHSKDRRTCSASSNSYKQSFRSVAESAGRSMWVAQGNPEGSCGIVQLSRFEVEDTQIGTNKFSNWKYIARKAITNPAGELFSGAKCSNLDETPYTYDWRAKEHQVSCDYVQFSPL